MFFLLVGVPLLLWLQDGIGSKWVLTLRYANYNQFYKVIVYS